MSEEQAMRRRIAAMQFAMWELHLFLDTHPNNCDAAKKLDDYKTPQNTSRWAWISDPWPWEKEGN